MIDKAQLNTSAESTREWLRGLPKAELHFHLEGSITPETLVELSHRNDAVPLNLEEAARLYVYHDFHSFLLSFKSITQRLHAPIDYEIITYNLVRQLAAQGVRHAEVYLSIGTLLDQARLDVDAVMEAAEIGRERGEREFGTTVLWIIDAVRHHGVEAVRGTFRKAASLRAHMPAVVGVGVGGDEAGGPPQGLREAYAEAKAAGLRLTCHDGEACGPSSIRDALEIGAERIGHALTAQEDSDLIDILKERQVPLELCISSNVRTACCSTVLDHPVKQYLRKGLMVTINSDDPPFFGAHLLDEYELVHNDLGFSLDQIRKLAANSFSASFLSSERKAVLLNEVERH